MHAPNPVYAKSMSRNNLHFRQKSKFCIYKRQLLHAYLKKYKLRWLKCSDTLTFGKPDSCRQWYNSSLSSLIFIFSLNIWRANQLERSKSLLSEQINATYGQTLTTGSPTTVPRILALPLSSNCRSLNQISKKGPGSVTLCDAPWQFGLLQLYVADDRR
jgi:hypothetical protein